MLAIRIHNSPPVVPERVARALRQRNFRLLALRSLANFIQDHLQEVNDTKPNKKGWPRQNWYAKVKDSVNFQDTINGGKVAINEVGAALRFYGGTVKPVKKLWLTIPAIADAYGKRALEFRNLHFVLFSEVNAALMRRKEGGRGSEVVFWLVKKAKVKPFPGMLPKREEIIKHVVKTIDKALDRMIRRANRA